MSSRFNDEVEIVSRHLEDGFLSFDAITRNECSGGDAPRHLQVYPHNELWKVPWACIPVASTANTNTGNTFFAK